jgi:small subunit ribosomal protein S2
MGGIPDVMFVIDANKEELAIKEANVLGIPVVAILDSNVSPDGIAFPIPANDDAARAIRLYCDAIAQAASRGGQQGAASRGVDLGAMDEPPAEAVLAEPVAEAPVAEAPAPVVEAVAEQAPAPEAVAEEVAPEVIAEEAPAAEAAAEEASAAEA